MFDLYERIPWYDTALHFKAGWGVSLIASYVLLKHTNLRNPIGIALVAASVSINVGVQWELFEYMMDQWFGLNMQKSGLDDTMTDFMADSLGAVIGALAAYRLCLGKSTGLFLKTLRRVT